MKDKPRDIRERTFQFAVDVVRLCEVLALKPGVIRTLACQLLRAGTSIGAMVEEAQAAQSRADFNNKYNIALKEARQSIYWLRLLNVSGIMLMNNLKHFARRQSKLLELSVQS